MTNAITRYWALVIGALLVIGTWPLGLHSYGATSRYVAGYGAYVCVKRKPVGTEDGAPPPSVMVTMLPPARVMGVVPASRTVPLIVPPAPPPRIMPLPRMLPPKLVAPPVSSTVKFGAST